MSETRALLTQLAGAELEPGVELTDRIYRLTGGNPLFIEHAAHALRSGHDPFAGDGGLLAVLGRRISALGTEAQELLSIAAAVGERFDVSLVVAIAGKEEAQVWRLLRSAVHAHIVKTTDDQGALIFVHAALREAAGRFVLHHERAMLHAMLLDRLESSADDAGPVVLARHAELAGDQPRFTRYSEAAGDAAYESGDFKRAAHHLDRAVAAASVQGKAAESILRKAALAWVAAGNTSRAAQLWEDFGDRRSARPDAPGEAEARAQAVRAEFSDSRLERLNEAILLARAAGPTAELATALAASVHAAVGGTSRGGRALFADSDEALTMARLVGQDEPLAMALLARGHILTDRDDFVSFQVSHLARAAINADRGRWDEVDAELRTLLAGHEEWLGSWYPGAMY